MVGSVPLSARSSPILSSSLTAYSLILRRVRSASAFNRCMSTPTNPVCLARSSAKKQH